MTNEQDNLRLGSQQQSSAYEGHTGILANASSGYATMTSPSNATMMMIDSNGNSESIKQNGDTTQTSSAMLMVSAEFWIYN